MMLLAVMAVCAANAAKAENGRFLADYYSAFFINGFQQSLLLSGKHSPEALKCVDALPKHTYSEQYLSTLKSALSAHELKEADRLYAADLGAAFIDVRKGYVQHELKRLKTGEIIKYEVDAAIKKRLLDHAASPLGKKIESATTKPDFQSTLMDALSATVKDSCDIEP